MHEMIQLSVQHVNYIFSDSCYMQTDLMKPKKIKIMKHENHTITHSWPHLSTLTPKFQIFELLNLILHRLLINYFKIPVENTGINS